MGKYSDFPSQNTLSETKICNLHQKQDDEHPCHFYMEVPHPPPPRKPFLQLEMIARQIK